jgi:hypothetical protein
VFCVLLSSQQSTINHQNVPRFCNRHVNRLLLDSVPLTCDVERFEPQTPLWEALMVRVHLLQRSNTAHHAA